MYFEKFIGTNSLYLRETGLEQDDLEEDDLMKIGGWKVPFKIVNFIKRFKHFNFMALNLIFTAFVGLGGLTMIPFCLKMIKQGKTKAKIFYILTFIQILLQTTFPFIRAYLVIGYVSKIRDDFFHSACITGCALVGFQVYSFPIA